MNKIENSQKICEELAQWEDRALTAESQLITLEEKLDNAITALNLAHERAEEETRP